MGFKIAFQEINFILYLHSKASIYVVVVDTILAKSDIQSNEMKIKIKFLNFAEF